MPDDFMIEVDMTLEVSGRLQLDEDLLLRIDDVMHQDPRAYAPSLSLNLETSGFGATFTVRAEKVEEASNIAMDVVLRAIATVLSDGGKYDIRITQEQPASIDRILVERLHDREPVPA